LQFGALVFVQVQGLPQGGYAGSSTNSTYKQTVDNTTSRRFRASRRWGSSSYSGQRHGTNYRFLKKSLSISDNAKFKIKTPARTSYAINGWWPASKGYNSRTTFRIQTVNVWGKKTVSQRKNGGRWISLGRHTLDAGDSYRVKVSSRSSGKGYIIADAVKVVRK
jgi:hypothetical protein